MTTMDRSISKNTFVANTAGGIGSRFWPINRIAYPITFLDILDTGKTLLHSTFKRYSEFIPEEKLILVASFKDLIIVDREDAHLVVIKSNTQELKSRRSILEEILVS